MDGMGFVTRLGTRTMQVILTNILELRVTWRNNINWAGTPNIHRL